jgi:excisionase family DNA binding protein
LGCHLQTVYSWIDSGKLVAARVGRRFIRVDLKSLEEDLEVQAQNPAGRKGRGL